MTRVGPAGDVPGSGRPRLANVLSPASMIDAADTSCWTCLRYGLFADEKRGNVARLARTEINNVYFKMHHETTAIKLTVTLCRTDESEHKDTTVNVAHIDNGSVNTLRRNFLENITHIVLALEGPNYQHNNLTLTFILHRRSRMTLSLNLYYNADVAIHISDDAYFPEPAYTMTN